jgi:hypothetical protein
MINRRDFLQIGFSTGLGLNLPQLLRAEQDTPPKAKSIIHIFLSGGISHQDSFDYKRFNPSEYRGPFNGVETAVKGEYFGESFAKLAKIANKLTVIRSTTHGEAAHERGTHNMFTGYKPSPALKYPSMGSVVSHELGIRNNLPPYIAIPTNPLPIADPAVAGSGFLSTSFGPFGLGGEPSDPNFTVKDLTIPSDINNSRFNRRRSLLTSVDDHFKQAEKGDNVVAMDDFYTKAFNLVTSPTAIEAFNLNAESDKLRDEYGRNPAGQRLILARRLVEAGVRFVSVAYGSWDHHSNLKGAYMQNAPQFDQALTRLITDLEERGLLSETMVVVNSEFGRTPKINNTGGRDHWPRVFSTVMAGGGIAQGAFYGTSDALATEPDENPVTPADISATIFTQLGINPEKSLMTTDLRPVKITYEGTPISKII